MAGEAINYNKLPFITERDAQTAGPGLYAVKNRRRVCDWYRADVDDWYRDCEQVMIARVDDGKELPKAVHHARIRPDGLRLIVSWIPLNEVAGDTR